MKNKRNCNILPVLLATLSLTYTFAQDSTLTNSIGMELVLIKPGSFVMGKFQPPYPVPPDTIPTTKPGQERGYNAAEYALAKKLAEQDAQPGFTAIIRKPFYIGKFEVTQAQWKKVMGKNPSVFQGSNVLDDAGAHPVENITWNDAQQFLKKLNALEKGRQYRLPTEVEWEWAARAGATDDIPWAQIRATAQMGTRTTNKAGGKMPNAWGLYDMLGNVWEWVQDIYNEKLFADPTLAKKGGQHVLKGASFVGDVKNATYMTHAAGPGNGWDVGFRVVLEVPQQ
jgi:formylglycine-generating enzyme required for sulfatase activity